MIYLRLEVVVDEDVKAVELETVLVVDDDSLTALQAEDKNLVDVVKQLLHLHTQTGVEIKITVHAGYKKLT
jgi:hypothetical protein